MKLLVADDEQNARVSLSSILVDSGFEVVEANVGIGHEEGSNPFLVPKQESKRSSFCQTPQYLSISIGETDVGQEHQKIESLFFRFVEQEALPADRSAQRQIP